jgi:hypothetical protein
MFQRIIKGVDSGIELAFEDVHGEVERLLLKHNIDTFRAKVL